MACRALHCAPHACCSTTLRDAPPPGPAPARAHGTHLERHLELSHALVAAHHSGHKEAELFELDLAAAVRIHRLE
eukprot:501127-Prymnesium_polylepis.1